MSMAQQKDEPKVFVTLQLAEEFGLSRDEFQLCQATLGRKPNVTELGIFAAMWSEHCSYKSSKKWLKTLPTKGDCVIQGPGENAGVIDIGDGQAAVFKIESHNSPSQIEPYQGAATGVGGILRDVFTMGARPIANLNALRFGDPSHPNVRRLLSGVVAGIGGYGNCIGVPTVAGEVNFHKSYNQNVLVNAMTVGLAQADKIFYSKAAGVGNSVMYVGAKTGRDGIHGATMSSAPFEDDIDEKRPTVQVGDPFTEKLLLEACLELMAGDAIVSIQDMGAAGLTSSSVEMASKGGVGIELHLEKVPMREEGMTPYELMLSESQERMLMVIKPGREDEAKKIFQKWDLDCEVIGTVTDTGHLRLFMHGELAADIAVDPLVENSPEYDRPWALPATPAVVDPENVAVPPSVTDSLKTLMGCPDLASRRWIWEQYDHMVMGDTIQLPGGDAGVVRVHGTKKALAMTTDCTPRYCVADPVTGGAQAVVETWRNITATGGTPLAITNCLNFGNPEREEIMGQFVGCVTGMRNACEALSYPVVSGNVSLYKETSGVSVQPTPVIGGVGVIDDASKMMTLNFKHDGDAILLVGETSGWLGATLYLREIAGREEGAPPPIDFDTEKRNGNFVRGLIHNGAINACHDVSDGGALVAITEMALAGNKGADLNDALTGHAWFAEDQARYVITTYNKDSVMKAAQAAGVPVVMLGMVAGASIKVAGGDVALSDLRHINEGWLPNYMAQ